MTAEVAIAFGRALVDEWARAGVRVAALGPGSRSTPLALALACDERVRLEVFLDERSAAYFALGAAKASGRPAVVLTTSGTAATLLHSAVVEASYACAPLIACTADRPPELRDTGAGQAIDQIKLFGDAVRWFAEVGVPDDAPGAGRYWRSLASRAVAESLGPPAGPVHLNLAFREPLVPAGPAASPGVAPTDVPARSGGAPWVVSASRRPPPHADAVSRLAEAVSASRRGVVLAGWGAGADPAAVEGFAATAGWPVLADTVSGLRSGPHAVSTYDPLLRVPGFADAHRPDLVLRLGAAPTGRAASGWLDASVPQLLVDPDGAWRDPQRGVGQRMVADPTTLLEAVTASLGTGHTRSDWLDGWLAAERRARRAIDDLLDSWSTPFEGRVARDLVAGVPHGTTLVAGSSMPVRDLESFAPARPGLRFVANRGASGIDGFTSTVLGVAAGGGSPVVALCGDLTVLHDLGGLVGAARRGLDAVLVVLDNDGGGIFSFLPQAGLPEHFELLFGTPHGTDLVAVAAALGVPARRATAAGEVVSALEAARAEGGLQLVVVPTDRVDNVTRHAQVWAAVAEALAADGS